MRESRFIKQKLYSVSNVLFILYLYFYFHYFDEIRYAMDMLGFGRSSRPKDSFKTPEQAEEFFTVRIIFIIRIFL